LNRKWKTLVLLAGIALVAAACNVVSTPTAPSSWFFLSEGANSNGVYVNGPGTPPVGRGSALLSIDSSGREAIASASYSGLSLSGLSTLQYSTYQTTPNATGGAPNLEFDVDYDSSDGSTAYQGRLVYVPDASGTPVTAGTWQTWDTMSGGGAWYSSQNPIVGGATQTPVCTQTAFCTWSAVKAAYPNAQIRGLLLLRVGGNGDPGSAAVDNLQVGIGSATQFTDFDPGDGHIAVTSATAAGLGFAFVQDSGTTGSGAFVTGPNGADGSGSAQLTIKNAGDGEALATNVFAGTHFSDLTFLSYKTYQPPGAVNATTLQFDADYDYSDATTSFQGRVVFEPRESTLPNPSPVKTETWQTWNPMTATTGWWQTGNAIVGNGNVGQTCTQGSPCSFQQLLAAYPKLSIRPVVGVFANGTPNAGGIWLKAGSNWTPLPFVGSVDSLTVAVKNGDVNGTVTYDLGG
jgi:hypothetical protein